MKRTINTVIDIEGPLWIILNKNEDPDNELWFPILLSSHFFEDKSEEFRASSKGLIGKMTEKTEEVSRKVFIFEGYEFPKLINW